MKEKKDVLRHVKEEAENIMVPESITPEKIRPKLERIESDKGKSKSSGRRELAAYIAVAAGICLLLGGTYILKGKFGGFIGSESTGRLIAETENTITEECTDMTEESGVMTFIEENVEESELFASIEYPEIAYEDIYESMFGNWEEMKYQYNYRGEIVEGSFEEEIFMSDGAIPEAPAGDANTNIVFKEYAADEAPAQGMLAESAISEKATAEKMESGESKPEATEEYGTTNVQTQGVEEADVVKNDGRYLYQIIYQEEDYVYTQAIQIVDTKDGLTEVKRIDGFNNIQEFYVWEDTLVVIENKYLETVQSDVAVEKVMLMADKYYGGDHRQFHEITFYNIKDRKFPHKIKTFTLKGRYDSSRIADGYFYGFSKYYASPGEGETDYASYIPQVDGIQLEAEQILLPEENEGNGYLLLTSIDMKNPRKFVDTTAIVTDGDMYYVSSK